MLRELMALMGATAQEIVTMARSAFAGVGGAAAALAGTGARPHTDPAHEIAEAVMGREIQESRVQDHDWITPTPGIGHNKKTCYGTQPKIGMYSGRMVSTSRATTFRRC